MLTRRQWFASLLAVQPIQLDARNVVEIAFQRTMLPDGTAGTESADCRMEGRVFRLQSVNWAGSWDMSQVFLADWQKRKILPDCRVPVAWRVIEQEQEFQGELMSYLISDELVLLRIHRNPQ